MATIQSERADQEAQQVVQFNIRLDASTKARIEAAARTSKQSATQFAESALVEKANEVLARHEQIILSDRDYELFVQMMTSDAEPTELAKHEADEFKKGQMEGARFRW